MDRLREHLARIEGKRAATPSSSSESSLVTSESDNSTSDLTGNRTSEITRNKGFEITDHKSWLSAIEANGHQPSDWLEYIQFCKSKVTFRDEESRVSYITSQYAKAVKVIPESLRKRSKLYAQLFVSFAQFRSQYNQEDARTIFSMVRYRMHYFAFVYIANAQFELDCGNLDKCKKILGKGRDCEAQPREMLYKAYRRMVEGKTQLLEDEDWTADADLTWGDRSTGTFPSATFLLNTGNRTQDLLQPKSSFSQSTSGMSLLQPCLSGTSANSQQEGLLQPKSSFSRQTFSSSLLQPCFSGKGSGLEQEALLQPKVSFTHLSSKAGLPGTQTSFHQDTGVLPLQPVHRQPGSHVLGNPSNLTGDPLQPKLSFSRTEDLLKPKKSVTLTSTLLQPRTSRSAAGAGTVKVMADSEGKESHRKPDLGVHLDRSTEPPCTPLQPTRRVADMKPDCAALSEDGDTAPAVLEPPSSVSQPPRTMRVCRSTPDCKNPSREFYHYWPSHKKPTRGPARVPRQALSGLERSGKGLNPMEDDPLVLQPLPETPQPAHRGPPPSETTTEQVLPETAIEKSVVETSVDMTDVSIPTQSSVDSGLGGESRPTSDHIDGVAAMETSPPAPQPHRMAPAVLESSLNASASTLVPTASSHVARPASVLQPAALPAPDPRLISPASSQPPPQALPAPPGPTHMPQPMAYPNQPGKEPIIVNGHVYSVMDIIGRGGTSKVYLVMNGSHKLFAIKCVDMEGADDITINSYHNEIALLRKLQSSSRVIRMYEYEYSETRNTLYVVMERGDTDLNSLFRDVKKRNAISKIMQMYYWEQMLEAVKVLHREGIAHCDLKPANFLLVAGQVKLIDFGIANAIQSDKTSVTRDQQAGTLNYISPEALLDTSGGMLRDENGRVKPRMKISVKSDVWSLGCILCNMVYGRTPFQHITNNYMKMQAIINKHHPIDLPRTDDQHLADVIRSCLQRNPAQRPSIEELLQHPYLQGQQKSRTGIALPNMPDNSGGEQGKENSQPTDSVSMKDTLIQRLQCAVNSPRSMADLEKYLANVLHRKQTGGAEVPAPKIPLELRPDNHQHS